MIKEASCFCKMNRKKSYLLFVVIFSVAIVFYGCNPSAEKNKLVGKWYSRDKKTSLKITSKEFILDEGEPIAESYFMKSDTLFTSYEGTGPYTKFLVKNLSDKSMTLVYPDSTSVRFFR